MVLIQLLITNMTQVEYEINHDIVKTLMLKFNIYEHIQKVKLGSILGISSLSHVGNRSSNNNALDDSIDSDKNRLSNGYSDSDFNKQNHKLINNNHIRPSSAEVLID